MVTGEVIIDLPCTARELENALHKACDHDGRWDAKVHYVLSHSLAIETENGTKEKDDEQP